MSYRDALSWHPWSTVCKGRWECSHAVAAQRSLPASLSVNQSQPRIGVGAAVVQVGAAERSSLKDLEAKETREGS